MKLIVYVIFFPIAIWAALSGLTFGIGDADEFQRLGSIGVAAAVLAYGGSRLLLGMKSMELPKFLQFVEISVLFWATLQWGYGDRLVHLLHGAS